MSIGSSWFLLSWDSMLDGGAVEARGAASERALLAAAIRAAWSRKRIGCVVSLVLVVFTVLRLLSKILGVSDKIRRSLCTLFFFKVKVPWPKYTYNYNHNYNYNYNYNYSYYRWRDSRPLTTWAPTMTSPGWICPSNAWFCVA